MLLLSSLWLSPGTRVALLAKLAQQHKLPSCPGLKQPNSVASALQLKPHEPTPLRVPQLLLGKLGEGVFSGCNPLRTVPRSLRDTRRLAAD